MPYLRVDPVLVACQVVVAAQSLVSRSTDPADCAVLSLPVFHAGSADNVIPQFVDIAGTIRTLRAQTRGRMEQQLKTLVTSVAEGLGASATVG